MSIDSSRDLLIALSLLPFLTPNRTRLLLEYFDPLEQVRHASTTLLQGLLSVTPEQADEVRNPLTKQRLALVASLRMCVVTVNDDAYPPMLKEIHDPPLALHVRGDASLLARPSIAIVG